jgi:monoamine oxidase
MRYDVIIVGAGVSGCVSASLLKNKGKRILILEARDRVGGRTYTNPEGIDLGGQWIGTCQPRVMRLLQQLDLEYFEQYDTGRHIMNFDGTLTEYGGNISESNRDTNDFQKRMTRFIETLDKMAKDYNGYKHLDSISARDWLEKNHIDSDIRSVVDWLFKVCTSIESRELSFYYWLYFLSQSGGYARLADIRGGAQEYRIRGGSMGICSRLIQRNGLDVVYNCVVQRIAQNRSGCIIETNGRTYYSDSVIITVPPKLNSSIEYNPPLPEEKTTLYNSIQMGRVIKIVVTYPEPWWRSKGYSGEIISNVEPIFLAYDACTDKYNALVCFVCADNVQTYKRDNILEGFQRYFGDERMLSPTGYYEKNWCEDSFSGGCYFGITDIGVLSQYSEEFRKPYGHLYWAGTETAREWMGYIEGAIESSERVVEQITRSGVRTMSRL